MEVPTIYKAYFLGLCKWISPENMAFMVHVWGTGTQMGTTRMYQEQKSNMLHGAGMFSNI